MNRTLAAVLGLSALSFALPDALAQVYQWKDSSGRTIISDSPPPANARNSRSVMLEPDPGGENRLGKSEKEQAFKKRHAEAREQADKESAAASEKRESCDRALRHVALLQSGSPLTKVDDKGQQRYLTDAARQAELQRAQGYLTDNCQ